MAATAVQSLSDFDVEDVEYLRHGDSPLLARIFKPRGAGPFPALVELHGGAWCLGERSQDDAINEQLARRGILVAALDFRLPPAATYPGSLADISYGIRWLKSRATSFNSRADAVSIFGISSGGHQAMLLGLRPDDPRYNALALPAGSSFDTRVRCVVMGAPVIDPLGRYHYAKGLKESGKSYPEFVDLVLPLHDKYWKNEDAMAEASPVRILERGEPVAVPPALYIQDTRDIVHPRPQLDRFVELYRRAGATVDLELFEGAMDAFTPRNAGSHPGSMVRRLYAKADPSSSSALRVFDKMAAFIHAHSA